MSVVIAVKVSEGIVLAADSAATLSGRSQTPQVTEGILKTFLNAKKLLQIGDFPIGVLTWGSAGIGMRTVESHIREWEYKNNWQSVHQYKSNSVLNSAYEVKVCAEGLYSHMRKVCLDEYGSKDKFPPLGILVAGYSEGKFFPEMWKFQFPFDEEIVNQRPDVNSKPDFGATWFGLTDALVRLHWGRDDRVLDIVSTKFNVPVEDLIKALAPLQYPIAFAQMPLQDAIEYCHFMISLAIGRFRFALGPELCGGAVDIAAISQTRFHWISQKSLRGAV